MCFKFFQASPRPEWPYVLWSSAATSFLLRPSSALRSSIAYDLGRLDGFQVAMHIRHCDKHAESILRPLRTYLQTLWDFAPGANAPIFLVTDDAVLPGPTPCSTHALESPTPPPP